MQQQHCVKLRDAGDFIGGGGVGGEGGGGGGEGGGWRTYLASQHRSRHLLLTPPVSPGAWSSPPKYCKYRGCKDPQNPRYSNIERPR